MKTMIVSVLLAVVGLSAHAAPMHKVATCSAPMLEGEYTVYLSADKKAAKVSYSQVEEYPVTKMYVSGPVMNFDFVTPMGTERVILAADGGHELHLLNTKTGRFAKVANLSCSK